MVVVLGGWWFTLALGVMVHLGLLEYFRLARFKGIRPASKTTLVLVQLLLITTQWAHGGDAQALGFSADLAAAVLPLSGAAICGWREWGRPARVPQRRCGARRSTPRPVRTASSRRASSSRS